jgi:hypothetical protein
VLSASAPSHTGYTSGFSTTGMRLWSSAHNSFGITRSKSALSVRCWVPGGERVMRKAWPSARCRSRRIASAFSAAMRASRVPISSASSPAVSLRSRLSSGDRADRQAVSPRIGIELGGHVVTLILKVWCWLNPIGLAVMEILMRPRRDRLWCWVNRARIPIRDDLVAVHREPGHRLVDGQTARDFDALLVLHRNDAEHGAARRRRRDGRFDRRKGDRCGHVISTTIPSLVCSNRFSRWSSRSTSLAWSKSLPQKPMRTDHQQQRTAFEPATAAQPWRREPLFMPHTCRSRYSSGSAQLGGFLRFQICAAFDTHGLKAVI